MAIAFIIALVVMFALLFRTSHTLVGGGLSGLLSLPLLYVLMLGLGTETGIEIAKWLTIALVVGIILYTIDTYIRY